jgi:hypothetical protein
MAMQPAPEHRWYTPADCAALLLAVPSGEGYRGPCPVHRGDSTDALHIFQGTDKYGHPKTILYCHAHQCPRAAICAEMGIAVKNLYAIQPAYAKATGYLPRAHSPRIARLKRMEDPSPDEIEQILLEEMIVSDPPFVTDPEVLGPEGMMIPNPARVKLWELAQARPEAKQRFTEALRQAHIIPSAFWEVLARTMPVRIQGRHPSSLTIGEGRDEA